MDNKIPRYSPWGEIQTLDLLCAGAYSVSTASHGGVMIIGNMADKLLSVSAQKIGFWEGGYLCFEEDCAVPIAIRELMDKGLYIAPVSAYFKVGEYEKVIDDSIKTFHPTYWAERQDRIHTLLPKQCFSVLPSTGALIIIKRGEKGYSPSKVILNTPEQYRMYADKMNKSMGITKAQEAAMMAGSMFGWGVPAADPKNYDDRGNAIKPKHKDRGDVR